MGASQGEVPGPVAASGIDVEEFRACARSFLRDHESLLLERSSMIFELDTAKSTSLREESRHSVLERENTHLRLELGSQLAVLGRTMSGILGHFSAAEALEQAQADIVHLTEELLQKESLAASLARETEGLKGQLQAIRLERETEGHRRDKEKRGLELTIKREGEKWKAQLAEATRTCQKLQDQVDRKSGQGQLSVGSASSSLELMWKQKVLSLQKQNKSLREEVSALEEKIREEDSFKPRAKPRKRTKATR
ncbi:hypothetical protein HOP50_03g21010 [Chloropicon primus]|uniref:Uncharacterized protein n=1 Tax=Chloropicon primus TaxID=1764295 RepID=A0A5B8MGM6_9CHLO|nr:hypothetical protein A3770_03p21010 [Chloropicon primus]UPQ98795.1 hypothetical protein HOP50_03g21010 [Chloropicon primus]|mmetsp:Transcript_6730/g.19702  ORF Transcript_6730/g.19702 Transcript_6730/m.19702 type:complete len:252 (-) Transcript_6730:86-841(-)|eukprot:QDZ19583.1 hypothetical protein A3770_03p21010 [Chloropicon primus]